MLNERDQTGCRLEPFCEQFVQQGSAAEALGLIGDAGAADAISRMVSQIVQSGAMPPAPSQPPADAEDERRDTPAAAFRRVSARKDIEPWSIELGLELAASERGS